MLEDPLFGGDVSERFRFSLVNSDPEGSSMLWLTGVPNGGAGALSFLKPAIRRTKKKATTVRHIETASAGIVYGKP